MRPVFARPTCNLRKADINCLILFKEFTNLEFMLNSVAFSVFITFSSAMLAIREGVHFKVEWTSLLT